MALTRAEKIEDLSVRIRGLEVAIRILARNGHSIDEYALRKNYLNKCKAMLMNGRDANKHPVYSEEQGIKPWYWRPAF